MPDKIKKKIESTGSGQKSTHYSATSRNKSQEKKKNKESSTNEKAKEKAAIAAMSRLTVTKSMVLDFSLANPDNPPLSQPKLAVDGVLFCCPVISDEILSKSQWKDRIREYLKKQLPIEQGITSCLMIHTLTPDKERVSQCIETLCTYIKNILQAPHEEKFKKIRIINKIFQLKVAPIDGAIDFLLAAGFKRKQLLVDGVKEDFLLYNDSRFDRKHLEILVEALKMTEPIQLEVFRNPKVLLPEQAATCVELPDDFFNFSIEDLKKEQKLRAQQNEMTLQLRTKAMRIREEQKALRKYRYTLIRIRFPDNTFLQGTFGIYEKLKSVKDFIRDNLSSIGKFNLVNSLGKVLSESDDNVTLLDLKLLPAVLLIFIWGHEKPLPHYLKSKLLSNFQRCK